ncbi:hypothetical protein [Salinicoccus roseus]|uniref:hypothetical protein n=1 Tax=Salinicoccus roseus TaxID=45670 RepID=UPI001EF56730|nr:hypothetical protein [Salinicoccus roseus]MCG7331198.1 hypothetical protein [Salinicoccus roseus]
MQILKRTKETREKYQPTEIFTETNKLNRVIRNEAKKLSKRLPNAERYRIIKESNPTTKEGKLKRLNELRTLEDSIAIKDEGNFEIPDQHIEKYRNNLQTERVQASELKKQYVDEKERIEQELVELQMKLDTVRHNIRQIKSNEHLADGVEAALDKKVIHNYIKGNFEKRHSHTDLTFMPSGKEAQLKEYKFREDK